MKGGEATQNKRAEKRKAEKGEGREKAKCSDSTGSLPSSSLLIKL